MGKETVLLFIEYFLKLRKNKLRKSLNDSKYWKLCEIFPIIDHNFKRKNKNVILLILFIEYLFLGNEEEEVNSVVKEV